MHDLFQRLLLSAETTRVLPFATAGHAKLRVCLLFSDHDERWKRLDKRPYSLSVAFDRSRCGQSRFHSERISVRFSNRIFKLVENCCTQGRIRLSHISEQIQRFWKNAKSKRTAPNVGMQDGSLGKFVCTVQPRGHLHVAVDVARASVTGAMCQMLDGEIDAALDALVLEEVG